ncbi:SpoIID/LytB domain-containing protein [Nitriliruptor alkaliphilus]|uniref:SpoIID/LytB domain-containing protein n=1 Tax=Nitriliruptor alkaliphilus TaxID=427918 RepID=UPI0006976B10|nr:SpoIID/LytB domain-containing protein [Nitriliruptor alkaliphilus]
MTRRTRLASSVLALALAVTLLPASAGSAQSGTPLRPSVRDQPDPNPGVVLRGRGWGHSVGMSQYGAYAMSREGRTHSQILQHYYPGTAQRTWSTDSPQRVTVQLATGGVTSTPAEAVGGAITWRYVEPNGTAHDPVTQPAGTSWTVRGGGTDNVNRVELRDAANDLVHGGNGTFHVSLTSMDEVRTAGARLRTYHPFGTRQYAYGRVEYRSDGEGKLGVTNRLPLESYLRGLGEVPSSWGASGGQQALEAQVIIARGYVLGRNRVTCATAACQVFVGFDKEIEATGQRWVDAVAATSGRYLVDGNGNIANTYYSSSHGGRTEASQDSWAYGTAVPYLVSVDDPWSLDAVNPMRSWTAVASNAEFRRVTGLGLSRIQRVEIMSRTAGGSPRVLRVTGPEGTKEFSTTASAAQSRKCNRNGYAGNSLRCDLATTVRNAAGDPFAGAGGRPPSSQIRSIGFAPFIDDDGNTHEYSIVWANAAGIAQGKTATTFAPRERVTRAQMASFIYRTFDIPKRTDNTFDDVNGGTHAEAISSVSAAGIAKGYSARRFGPDDPVTREQMASFIARAMGLDPVRPTFDDVPPNGTHAGNVGAIAERGITAGCRGNSYCPGDPVLRDQMASFLYRAARSLR